MNVLLYVFDALRADRVGTYGHGRDTTPCLDALADDGVVFEQCITPATWTRPAGASILSGLYPPAHGTRDIKTGYDPPVPSLPEHFRAAGYRTAAFGSMPNIRGDWGYDRGFDEYVDLFQDEQVKAEREELRPGVPHVRADDLTRRALEWFDEDHDGEPFFLMAWSNETHAPYDPPEEYRTYVDPSYDGPVDGTPESFGDVNNGADKEHLRALYDGGVRFNDDCFSDLLNGLRERGLYDDTLVVCIGDHGDGLGEHPGVVGHGTTPYEELIHVPFLVRDPGGAAGHRAEEVTSLVDLYPTLLARTGVYDVGATTPTVQGASLAGVIEGGNAPKERMVFVDGNTRKVGTNYRVARKDRWKLITTAADVGDGDGRDILGLVRTAVTSGKLSQILRHPMYYWNRHISSDELLFDLADDPNEQTNLINRETDVRAKFSTAIERWWEECLDQRERYNGGPEEVSVDEDAADRLKALGYLDNE